MLRVLAIRPKYRYTLRRSNSVEPPKERNLTVERKSVSTVYFLHQLTSEEHLTIEDLLDALRVLRQTCLPVRADAMCTPLTVTKQASRFRPFHVAGVNSCSEPDVLPLGNGTILAACRFQNDPCS
eukprot:SAG31_NODE_25481_length_460_cov_1.110803_1_plen_124_part_01